jgi:Na+/melibiose symporter-like transporter
MAALTKSALAAYAAVALPLAAAALPVHVQVPKFYAALGMDLALIGFILLAVRLLDAISDPLLGAFADRIPVRYGGRKLMIGGAAPFLAAGLWLLFSPPTDTDSLALWLTATLVLSYLGLSAASIGHFALGSALSRDYSERTRITAARGGCSGAGTAGAAVWCDRGSCIVRTRIHSGAGCRGGDHTASGTIPACFLGIRAADLGGADAAAA